LFNIWLISVRVYIFIYRLCTNLYIYVHIHASKQTKIHKKTIFKLKTFKTTANKNIQKTLGFSNKHPRPYVLLVS